MKKVNLYQKFQNNSLYLLNIESSNIEMREKYKRFYKFRKIFKQISSF